MEQTNTSSWVAELSALERRRREAATIAREAAGQFQQAISARVYADLNAYYNEFPNEAKYIKAYTQDGDSVIERERDEYSMYTGDRCCVRFSIEINALHLQCCFDNRSTLNRTFNLVVADDGNVGIADMDIAGVSRYLLTPVLFNRLDLDQE